MAVAILWVLVGITCATMWGIGYSFLAPASAVLKPSTINIIFGFIMMCAGLLVNVAQDDVTNLFEMTKQPRLGLSVLLYICLFISASWLQLWGYKLIDGNTGPYNAICSCYPLVNLIVSYLFFGQRNVNWPYVVPGMLLIMAGVAVLALAPPVSSDAANPAGAPTNANAGGGEP